MALCRECGLCRSIDPRFSRAHVVTGDCGTWGRADRSVSAKLQSPDASGPGQSIDLALFFNGYTDDAYIRMPMQYYESMSVSSVSSGCTGSCRVRDGRRLARYGAAL